MRLPLSLVALIGLWGASPVSAQVAPDGGTRTSVTTASTGRVKVNIAPANPSGISHNTYTDFSAPKPGLELNNRGIDASTIVNEVTSSRRSILNGPIEVIGSRAHVVVANPNGITVDGGRFINTGGVALSGGKVRFENAAAGLVNTVVTAGTGDIAIEGAGLSGAMTTLQLVAGRLKIDGPVSNEQVSPSADIALVGGRSEVELDSSVSPLTTLRPWAWRRAFDGAANGIVVDVTPRGSLSASRVRIAVNGRGAGVSYAGKGQATIGDFTISADGKVSTKGATLKSEKSLKIEASAIDIRNSASRQSTVSAVSGSVRLVANSGDITLLGQVTGAQRAEDDPLAKGGVTLKTARDIKLLSENGKRLAIAFASKDDLVVEAGRNVLNDTGRLLANATVVMRVAGRIDNLTGVSGAGTAPIQTMERRQSGFLESLFGIRRRKHTVTGDFGTARIPNQLGYISGEAVDIQSGAVTNSGEIDALDGALLINTGTLVNRGLPAGTYRIEKECGLTCWSRASSNVSFLGGVINAAGSAAITASAVVENGGQITSYGNLSVTAPRVIARATFLPDFSERPAGLFNGFAGPKAILSLSPSGGMFLAPTGTVTVESPQPVVLEGGLIEGKVATVISGGTDVKDPPKAIFLGGTSHIGLLGFLFE
ncbi:filamentous hemagglutinin N-terminal domain-containing protein [Microvirga thermotolerans]|uniref:Filamentous hemagglutinin N-terminal domain-containing protein n=1 Tax=Microvirga thermotolerans TaxID=2651334 RepID=A0A5P9K299_9HYPH|nr:filamentous hemagglutinin N-terminal domain-containing protein [Microvirga thermotolerans]QFU16334.1 filamentous hemagglutinin N-terminal domain-containing protein [Microvirga thermotolerans]